MRRREYYDLLARDVPRDRWAAAWKIPGEGNEATHLPADLKVEHACFSIERKAKASGRKITITTAFKNQCAEIAPKDYPAFRAAVQKAVVLGPDNVVFGPAGKAKKAPR